jgi:hypothetical protein
MTRFHANGYEVPVCVELVETIQRLLARYRRIPSTGRTATASPFVWSSQGRNFPFALGWSSLRYIQSGRPVSLERKTKFLPFALSKGSVRPVS